MWPRSKKNQQLNGVLPEQDWSKIRSRWYRKQEMKIALLPGSQEASNIPHMVFETSLGDFLQTLVDLLLIPQHNRDPIHWQLSTGEMARLLNGISNVPIKWHESGGPAPLGAEEEE